MLSRAVIDAFRGKVYSHYRIHGRYGLPWRNTDNPYHILVSEFMLQQTQVERVQEKYRPFIEAFPGFDSLACAELADVLKVWQGLGYNRRALMLWNLARTIIEKYDGNLPVKEEELCALSGIGKATAGSILAFAFNIPTAFIETNIRRVFIHEFFQDNGAVKDSEISPLVEETLDRTNPGEWYYALMDYGSTLKKVIENPNRRSAHYKKQPSFHDSDRKIRGMIIKILLKESHLTTIEIVQTVSKPDERVKMILNKLKEEGFVKEEEGGYSIANTQ